MMNYKNLGKFAGKAAIVFVVAGCVYFYGFNRGDTAGTQRVQAAWNAEKFVQAEALAKKQKEQAKVTIQTVTKYVDRVQVVREKGKTIIKEVPIYVQNDADLSGGFRVLHDAAASNELPDPTRVADALPVKAETVATTIAENYQQCYEQREQLISLQEWVNGVR